MSKSQTVPAGLVDEAGQGIGGSSETGYAAKHTLSAASQATLNTDKLEEVKKLFTAHLENKGLRKTGERYAILEEIYARSGHFDVEELYAGMKERGLQVSRATVYNTLDLLVEQGLVSKHQFGRNLAQYEKSYGYRQHDHVICTECHKVVEFCDPRIHGIQTMVGDLLNFHILHHSLNLYGVCGDCRAQAATPPEHPCMTTTSTVQNGILFVRLSGDLIGSPDTDQLLQTVNHHLGEELNQCAVDLSEVRYINSTGIGVLVSLLTKFRSRGGELVLINPAEHPKKMLAITKLNNIFTVSPDEATARQQLTPAAI